MAGNRIATTPTPLRIALCALLSGVLAQLSPPLSAQPVTSRPVVQPLPSQDTQRLNRALVELAKTPRSQSKLLEAGNAALAVGDLDAALGFFKRLNDLDSSNESATLGLARVYMRSGRPIRALLYFQAARARGAGVLAIGSDLALTYDMLGDHSTAQTEYLRVINASPKDDEARRRLALSFAITGKQTPFETTLRPLIDRRDFAAFRARTFGLAILGEQERASAIAEAVMPRTLAQKIVPYLAFMPRLTTAQQAAAASLGVFPRAADIGRDAPGVVAYQRDNLGRVPSVPSPSASPSAPSLAQASTDDRLTPTGVPLGSAKGPRSAPGPSIEIGAAPVSDQGEAEAVATSEGGADDEGDFEVLEDAQGAQDSQENADTPASEEAGEAVSAPTDVAGAFGDMADADPPKADAGPAAGAVDITTIDVPRESPPVRQPPANPSRIWVQVATGQDLEALSFDWRRIRRKAGDLLKGYTAHTVAWGQANRLLAGPLESREEARDLINALGAKGLDSFRYTSPEGLEIQKLETP